MTRRQIFSWFFFGIFLFLIYLFYKIIKPFILPLFWAGILALVLYPLYGRLTKFLKNRTGTSSLIMTILAVFVIVIPLGIVVTTLTVEIFDVYQGTKNQIEIAKLRHVFDHLKEFVPLSILEQVERRFGAGDINPEELVLKSVGTVSKYLFDQAQEGLKNLTILIVDICIMFFALFFFFRDGKRLYEEMKYLIPMTDEQKHRIFHRFYDILNAVILGVVVTAAGQGLIAGLIFWILGIRFAVLAGVLTFIFSLIPLLGAVAVWLPAGVYLIITGETLKGITLLILGALFISLVDNILKPMIIGGKTKLPTLFLFLSIIGSISAFGFSGIILGPVLLAVFISFIEIYRAEYREAKASE
jgi:predicted PurR-regulated permease PerM